MYCGCDTFSCSCIHFELRCYAFLICRSLTLILSLLVPPTLTPSCLIEQRYGALPRYGDPFCASHRVPCAAMCFVLTLVQCSTLSALAAWVTLKRSGLTRQIPFQLRSGSRKTACLVQKCDGSLRRATRRATSCETNFCPSSCSGGSSLSSSPRNFRRRRRLPFSCP
jgi:hypothetical protein